MFRVSTSTWLQMSEGGTYDSMDGAFYGSCSSSYMIKPWHRCLGSHHGAFFAGVGSTVTAAPFLSVILISAMSSSKRTHYQQDCHVSYGGRFNTHASHTISAAERAHFNLANRSDGPGNYRNCNAYTNQSVHRRIDEHFLCQSQRHSFTQDGMDFGQPGTKSYISPQEVARRTQAKINAAKDSK